MRKGRPRRRNECERKKRKLTDWFVKRSFPPGIVTMVQKPGPTVAGCGNMAADCFSRASSGQVTHRRWQLTHGGETVTNFTCGGRSWSLVKRARLLRLESKCQGPSARDPFA